MQKEIEEKKEEEIFLEGIGFSEKEDTKKLWTKRQIVDGETFYLYWDLRKKKPFFYVYKEGQEKAIPKQDAEGFEEFELFNAKFNGGSAKKEAKPKQNKITVLESKSDAYTLINQKDDAQVLAEIQGNFLSEFVYSFPTKEGKVTGLSWAGTKEIARRQGNISVEDINITETDKTYRVLCKAKDIQRNVTMFGVAEQSKMMHLKSGLDIEDLHALSKCVSRAQRNGIRALIPEIFIKKMIEQFLEK